jgi:cysteine desulfurase
MAGCSGRAGARKLMRIYLDHNATTAPAPAVVDAVARGMAQAWGNPSTLYGQGREARAVLDTAQARVAVLIGAGDSSEIVFTSGGTESDHLALTGSCGAGRGDHVVTSMAEHKAVLRTCAQLEQRGLRVTYLPVDSLGRVDPDSVRKAITPRTALCSVMLANNEVGTINPLPEIAAICHEQRVLLHTDAVQAPGRTAVDVAALGVDLLSISGHKLHGPRGTGALWVRRGTVLQAVLAGGSQERGLRPGTENVPGAHGLGVAAELAMTRLGETPARVRALRDRLWELVRAAFPEARAHGDLERGLCNVLNVSFPGHDAEELVLLLYKEGIEVGPGSGCTTGQTTPSHVLLAMGISPQDARSSVRFSLGSGNTASEIDEVAAAVTRLVGSRSTCRS